MARIIVTTSTGDQTHELEPGQTLTVGRDAANRLPLPTEAGLSRRHCRIGPREGGEAGWEVADLGSTNKTRVNGAPIQHKVLTHGDVIEIGSVKMAFEDSDEEKRLEALGKEGVCFLEWVTGDRKGERIVLSRKQTTIGRRDANVVALDDRMVSGHHAEIDRDLNGYTIRDLGSTNGTLVNGQPISEALLTHGARVRIGNARFAFKDPSMKDIEVELAHFEEDEGWGMMGEIDLSRAHGSRLGVLAVLVLFLAAGVGAWMLIQQEERGAGDAGAARAGLVENGDFEDDELLWTADREDGVDVRRNEKGGRKGAWLSVANQGGEGTGLAHVWYDRGLETVGSRPLEVRAQVKGAGGDGAELVAVWASDPTPEELKAGVTQVERTEVLAEATGGWSAVEADLVPPFWARTLRIGLRLPEGAGAGLDAVRVAASATQSQRHDVNVPTFKSAWIDAGATLDLISKGRRVLLVGVRPVARTADGEVLTDFRASSDVEGTEKGAFVEGAFRSAEGEEVPASIRWTTTVEGLRAEVSCTGAEAVGIAAGAPAVYVGGNVSVLGKFLPQRIPVTAPRELEEVSRTLVGDPVTGAGAGTLIAFVLPGNEPVATLEFVPSRDAGLVVFRHWVAGPQATLDVVSDFTKQRTEAEAALRAARQLAASSPGRAIQELRNVANAFPFEEQVREEALRIAGELETKAGASVLALEEALAEYEIYRSAEALARMVELSDEIDTLYLGEPGRGGSRETEVSELVAQVKAAHREHAVVLAMPGVDRLERIAALLNDNTEFRPMAALYWRTMLMRYKTLEGDAEDIARRIETAKKKFDELMKHKDVQDALPPVPAAK